MGKNLARGNHFNYYHKQFPYKTATKVAAARQASIPLNTQRDGKSWPYSDFIAILHPLLSP